eukprot:scaffold13062_cov129-Isochrysis_galbana.AAC.1
MRSTSSARRSSRRATQIWTVTRVAWSWQRWSLDSTQIPGGDGRDAGRLPRAHRQGIRYACRARGSPAGGATPRRWAGRQGERQGVERRARCSSAHVRVCPSQWRQL